MAAKPKTTFTVTAPDGTDFTWTTVRPTSHGVLIHVSHSWQRTDPHWEFVASSSRPDLAVKEANKWLRAGIGKALGDGGILNQVTVVEARVAQA